jgi:hypothetical protein
MKEEYLRIGTSYFKIVSRPNIDGKLKELIIPWNRPTIMDDHGKITTAIRKF